MNGFELCENSDQQKITSKADEIRAGEYKSLNVHRGS